MLFILITLLLVSAIILISLPLMATQQDGPDATVYNREKIFKKQIEEIDEEEKNGLLTQETAEGLRLEAQRRLLKAAASHSTIAETTQPQGKEKSMSHYKSTTAIILAAIVTAGAVALYGMIGQPQIASVSRPATSLQPEEQLAATSTNEQIGDVDTMIAGLAQKLEDNPDDVEGWRMLGWSLFNRERYQQSAQAYKRAIDLSANNAEFWSAYGEALVMAAGGFVTEEAQTAFGQTIKLNPQDPRARFFKGLALDQSGKTQEAITAWIEIVNNAPLGAEWAPDLRNRIVSRAEEIGMDISGRLKSAPQASTAPAAPSAAQVEAAMEMPAQDRQAMIENMVSGLATKLENNPRDADGWARLLRSRMVLGQKEQAQRDLQSALDAFADDESVKTNLRNEAINLGVVNK
ncbi:MAG: c-type cytochrome biogenesis protein CcmI [bacterium]